MSKYKYTEFERQLNVVLAYLKQSSSRLGNLPTAEMDESIRESIRESEKILKKYGFHEEQLAELRKSVKLFQNNQLSQVLVVPSWERLCREAERSVGSDYVLENLFTKEELQENEIAIERLNDEFDSFYRLDKIDVTICVVAGLLGAMIDILLVGVPKKTPDGLKAGPLSNYIRNWFEKRYSTEEIEKLANSPLSKVPYDAQDNRNTSEEVEGLSSYYHRLLTLGHDPLLGFIVGVFDILAGRMTSIDKAGNITSQVMDVYADRKESSIFAAIAKQFVHLKTDVTTSMGLPVPLMSLFNLLQFGKIGDEDQTIAQIVQGMYYQGYDFIHFCSMSIPIMLIELVTRICYAVRKIDDGCGIMDSIPVTTNPLKHPKLRAMLFIAHSIATSVNAGKVFFTKNPVAINYPQWFVFVKYTLQNLRWILYNKPIARDAYVHGILDEQLFNVFDSVNAIFDEIATDYVVVFE